LEDLLLKNGAGLVDTPSMCELLLKQHMAQEPEALAALLGFYRLGRVKEALTCGYDKREEMIQQAVQQQGLSLEAARWALAAWTISLGEAVAASATNWRPQQRSREPLPPPLKGPETRARMPHKWLHVMVVTLAGALGSALPASFWACMWPRRAMPRREPAHLKD
jgi:hypothetical protein